VTDVEWHGKAILVLGLGDTGLSCVRWLEARGAKVRAADTREAPPALGALQARHPGVEVALGAFSPSLLAGVDAVVASPGVALREPVLVAARERGLEVVGDVEIFGRELARRRSRARVLGITGTNGKSTVTALAGEMARAAGLRTVVAGNIGLPVLDALDSPEGESAQAFVVELSSYQLETTSSLALDAATVLNITQDHLDRYDSMAAYAAAKARIFRHCRARVANRDDPATVAMAMDGERVLTFGLGVPGRAHEWGLDEGREHLVRGEEALMRVDEVGIPGLHNVANALAAHALGSAIGLPAEPMARAIREFRGLPHRVQLVAEARGVRFYDDSKGTNVGAAVAALEGFTTPVVLIAGGDGKGQDFAPLARAAAARARAVVLIGRDAPGIATALAHAGVATHPAESMEAAVRKAFSVAREGDAVLLSPACASFDMFRNYGHRGEAFAAAARALSRDASPDA
jgi:UDP-N-acetylmuramoylalanine--D-glutamate ligase